MKIGLVATAGLLLLAGCSSVPDAINPVEWYRGVAGQAESDAAPAPSQTASQAAGDQSYPNLASVPARPADISSPGERRATQQGLVADRDQARYTDQQPSNAVGAASAQTLPSQTPAVQAPTVRAPGMPSGATATPAQSVEPVPPAARIAPRAEPTEPRSAGAAMLERRRQEVLAERAAAAADERKAPQPPAAVPQPETVQPDTAKPTVPAATAEAAPAARTAAEVYREEFARSASPVATRSAEPAPAAPEPATPAMADKTGISYLAATILFDHGSTALDAAGRDTLRKIAAEYRKSGGTLRIVGHASSRTTDMRPLQHQLANFQVSVSRAEAVAQELTRLGVPAKAMQVAGVGDSQPIYYEVMPAGEAGNRRVEVFVDY